MMHPSKAETSLYKEVREDFYVKEPCEKCPAYKEGIFEQCIPISVNKHMTWLEWEEALERILFFYSHYSELMTVGDSE